MSSHKILVIHEMKLIRNMLKGKIQSEFHGVFETLAIPPQIAYAKIEDEKYEMVICGKDMIEWDDRNLYEELIKSKFNVNTPFVVLSSPLNEAEISGFKAKGIEHFLFSPLTSLSIKTKINELCNPRKWRKKERFNIPNTRVLLLHKDYFTTGKVINLSVSGVLCEVKYWEEVRLFKCKRLTLQFSKANNDARIQNLECKLLSQKAVSWDENKNPDKIFFCMEYY